MCAPVGGLARANGVQETWLHLGFAFLTTFPSSSVPCTCFLLSMSSPILCSGQHRCQRHQTWSNCFTAICVAAFVQRRQRWSYAADRSFCLCSRCLWHSRPAILVPRLSVGMWVENLNLGEYCGPSVDAAISYSQAVLQSWRGLFMFLFKHCAAHYILMIFFVSQFDQWLAWAAGGLEFRSCGTEECSICQGVASLCLCQISTECADYRVMSNNASNCIILMVLYLINCTRSLSVHI